MIGTWDQSVLEITAIAEFQIYQLTKHSLYSKFTKAELYLMGAVMMNDLS